MTYHIFIGYDDREHEAYLVAKYSLEEHSKVPIKVHKLHHKELRQQGLYTRGYSVDGTTGQCYDDVDERPFSTQFTFTRFLIAELWRRNETTDKSPLVMFMDCDFLVIDDIGKMFAQIEKAKAQAQGKHPVYCVKHDYTPKGAIKMDGIAQSKYNMKLWAAMMVLDMEHEDNSNLTPRMVNTAGGRDLMNFCWVDCKDTIFGLDEKWQYIPNHSHENTDEIAIIHWTEGGPYFSWYREDCGYSDLWFRYYEEFLRSKLKGGKEGIWEIIDG